MAVQRHAETKAEAEARLRPYLETLKALVRRRYPDAEFSFQRGLEPDSWFLDAYIPVDDDPELEHELAELATDFLVHDDVDITTIPQPRWSKVKR